MDKEHVLLGNFIDFLTAFAAFNIAYFNSDRFRNIFNSFTQKNATDIDVKANSVIEVITQSSLGESHKLGATNTILSIQRLFAQKAEWGEELLLSQKKLLPYFWISSILCLALVVVAGVENMFETNRFSYLWIYRFNLLFICTYLSNSIFRITNIFLEGKSIILIGVLIPIVCLYFWVTSYYGNHQTKYVGHSAYLAIFSSIIIAILPYLSDLILGGIVYLRNKKFQTQALSGINDIEGLCNFTDTMLHPTEDSTI